MLNEVAHRITTVIKRVNDVPEQNLYTRGKEIYLTIVHVSGYNSPTRVKYSS